MMKRRMKSSHFSRLNVEIVHPVIAVAAPQARLDGRRRRTGTWLCLARSRRCTASRARGHQAARRHGARHPHRLITVLTSPPAALSHARGPRPSKLARDDKSGLSYGARFTANRAHTCRERFTALLRDAAADDGGLGAVRCRLKISSLIPWLGTAKSSGTHARALTRVCSMPASGSASFVILLQSYGVSADNSAPLPVST